ncbi:MAG: DsbA family protein [Myxococcota bacterium]
MVGWKFRLPRGDKQWVAYGDLNCPFCFALEQRLAKREIASIIEWRLVEHAPDLPFNGSFATPAQLEELGVEIESLQQRAPDVSIALPRFRSNSRRAIEAVAEASLVDPDKADGLRRSLFTAMWREQKDIASVELLQALAKEAGLPVLKGTAKAREEKLRWTNEWRAGGFRRIPVLVSGRNAVLEGLPTMRRLDVFLRNGLFSSSTEDACEPQPPAEPTSTLDPAESA